MRLFMISMRVQSPVVLDNVTLPCLRILQALYVVPATDPDGAFVGESDQAVAVRRH